MSIEGKVVIVTGAARGIGLAYCRDLLAHGARVLAADISAFSEPVSAEHPDRIAETQVDVADMASVQTMADKALEKFGRIDGLINNAALYGALKGGRFTDIDDGEWDAAMRVNVKGIWNCCKAVVPAMREQGSGSIVNIASLAALYGTPYALHYSTSKAAVIGLTRALAREVGKDGIRVNAIAPTAVPTEGTAGFFGAKAERALEVIRGGQAIPRTPEASDISGAALWLLSDASAFVTGQTISVDGGTVMH